MRPPRQTGLYVDYVEKAGLVDYCTVQQDDDLLGPHEWYKIWTCDMYALVLLLVAEILQRLVPLRFFNAFYVMVDLNRRKLQWFLQLVQG